MSYEIIDRDIYSADDGTGTTRTFIRITIRKNNGLIKELFFALSEWEKEDKDTLIRRQL